MLDELGIAKADRSTTGVTVAEEYDHTPAGRRSLGHRAQAGVQIRFADAERIGRLMSRASDDLGARVDGPRWSISPGNPARLEAAKRAAANARAKAAAYASGVDAQLGPLIRLAESRTVHGVEQMARAASAGGHMPIEAGEHEVVAAIEATFALRLTG